MKNDVIKVKMAQFSGVNCQQEKRDENENGINDRIVSDYYVVRLSRKEKNTTENLIVYNKNKKKNVAEIYGHRKPTL